MSLSIKSCHFKWKVALPVQQLQVQNCLWEMLQIIYLCHEACILLPHFLVSALKCLLKVWETISRISVSFHKVPKCKQLHLNHCQLQIMMENGSLFQSNWHTLLYISVSEDSRLQLMVHFTLWRIMFIRKKPFTCSPAQFGWKPSLCNTSWKRRNREVCASCRGQK